MQSNLKKVPRYCFNVQISTNIELPPVALALLQIPAASSVDLTWKCLGFCFQVFIILLGKIILMKVPLNVEVFKFWFKFWFVKMWCVMMLLKYVKDFYTISLLNLISYLYIYILRIWIFFISFWNGDSPF